MAETKNIESMWRKVFDIVNHRKQALTLIHLFYTILGFMIFVPLMGLLGQLFLKLSS